MIRPSPTSAPPTAAIEAARAAVQRTPDDAGAWLNLGNAAMAARDAVTAEAAFSEGAQRFGAHTATRAQFLIHRGRALLMMEEAGEAVACAREAIATGLDDLQSLLLASAIFTQAHLPLEALPLLVTATQRHPANSGAWYALSGVLRFAGELDDARYALEKALACPVLPGEETFRMHFALAQVQRWRSDDNHIARLNTVPCRSPMAAAAIAYALFKECNDIGDTETAWEALQYGAHNARTLGTWTTREDTAAIDAWRHNFPPERFAARDTRPRTGPRRIFIIGLPRSGTTLVERILAAHSQVQALGELTTFAAATRRVAGAAATRDAMAAAASSCDPLEIAAVYDRQTAYLHDGSAFTIDKFPANHEHAGLIRLAFPDALIVHLRRNPMDSLFGAYKLLFNTEYRWSYDQADLADHYSGYRRLMDHWSACLAASGQSMIEVSLEALIDDPDTQIRRLLDACGLPFEPDCLTPHKTAGAVTTASATQVRKPINAEGVGAWRRYAAQLEPLKQRLMFMGFIDSDGNAL